MPLHHAAMPVYTALGSGLLAIVFLLHRMVSVAEMLQNILTHLWNQSNIFGEAQQCFGM